MRSVTLIGMTALILMAVLWGCSKSGSITLDANGKHPANWIVDHREAFRSLAGAIDDPAIARKSQCVECHGSDLKGGITKVSCFSQGFAAFSCHFHPAGFAGPDSHGTTAKGFGTAQGLKSCQGCHGTLYAGGVLSPVSCFPCHGVNAPHPGNWATSTTRRHSTSDTRNAAECAQCHSGGRLLTNLPAPPPQPVGTPPGCFNNTLCHGGLHPDGWIAPAQHGLIAKSQPGSDKGFTRCQTCHGTDFAGGTAQVSCFSASRANGACHVRNGVAVNAPHSPLPWRANSPAPTHTSTVDDAQGLNAGVCARCHLRGANLRTQILTSFASGTPGCFNSTLCHGAVGHPLGWAEPAQHGETGKANLTFCQTCHSDNPAGGPGSNPRFNVAIGRLGAGCEDCHQPLTAHPPVLQVPAAFGIANPTLNTPWFRHRTATNFDACNRCHGAGLEGGVGPRCQECHVAALPTATVNSPDPCSSCHSSPPSGTAYPNIGRVHSSHKNLNVATGALCSECHGGLGSGTLDHFLRAKNIRLGSVIPANQTSAQPNAVVFGGALSRANGATPVFDPTTLQCSNTYCHGTTLVSNRTSPQPSVISAPTWNTPFVGIHCDKCHGYPPSTASHASNPGPPACINCHSHVNASGTGFTDPTKHINGSIEAVLAHPFPNPGSAHRAAANGTGCLAAGCHAQGTAAASPYPVAGGTPPNCRACHLNANPTTDPNCSDCHGNAANGRPNGTTFPNRAGEHNREDHPQFACTVCHPFTSGDARHGWSGGSRSASAQVVPALNWNPGTRAVGQGTCNPSAGGLSGCHGPESGWY